MKKLKALVDLSGQAGSHKKGQKFEAVDAYSEFLINMKFAEEVVPEPKEEEPKAKKNGLKLDEGHK